MSAHKQPVPVFLRLPLDIWIQILIAACTLAAVIVSLAYNSKTMTELQKQRRAQFRPQLIFGLSQPLRAYQARRTAEATYSFAWTNGQLPDSADIDTHGVHIDVYNVGLGAAVNVQIVVEYDVQKAMENVRKACSGLVDFKEEGTPSQFRLMINGGPTDTLFPPDDLPVEVVQVGFLLPTSSELGVHPAAIEIPYNYLKLVALPLLLKKYNKAPTGAVENAMLAFDSLSISAIYQDEGGHSVESKYSVALIPSLIGKSTIRIGNFEVMNQPGNNVQAPTLGTSNRYWELVYACSAREFLLSTTD